MVGGSEGNGGLRPPPLLIALMVLLLVGVAGTARGSDLPEEPLATFAIHTEGQGSAQSTPQATPSARIYFPLVSRAFPTPTPTPSAATPLCNDYSDSAGIGLAIVESVNVERVARGLAPLQVDAGLMEGSQWKASDFVARDYFDHVSPPPDQENCFERSARLGTTLCLAEDIAYLEPVCEQSTDEVASGITSLWMGSEPHAATLLSQDYRLVGAGAAYDSDARRLYGVVQLGQ